MLDTVMNMDEESMVRESLFGGGDTRTKLWIREWEDGNNLPRLWSQRTW